eukprot:TRINITY_DN51308_c0_g1_i1.p1 TRINITY_DN51308_c0_g1~~TRINITY_DN51308_c0_g1_i1.p1  ORF type:complete len:169 (-),score=16.32 TRINITY_DN51308_c0_g1_i1:45-551(-)
MCIRDRTWTEPKILINGADGALVVIPVVCLFSNTQVSESTLVFVYRDLKRKMHLMVSYNHGLDFTKDYILTKEEEKGEKIDVAVAGPSFAYAIHTQEDYKKRFTFFVYDFQKDILKQLDEPFSGTTEISSPWVSASSDPASGKNFVRLFTAYYGRYETGGFITTMLHK